MMRHPAMIREQHSIVTWLAGRVAAYLDAPPHAVDPTVPLAELGLDSACAVSLCGEIEDRWELQLDATIVFDYPTIVDLAGFIADETAADRESAA
ncbi:acyl carrier protein [Nocardia yamanashiensis]|uniref:acyl carrier protein n=1 Tax=Nocardia yamanashiensis TaxID=209247 RepID=UPI000A8098FA|nr:acyl carrier protein [Nocardia yamanashiensis]